jgi:hypothetical protein
MRYFTVVPRKLKAGRVSGWQGVRHYCYRGDHVNHIEPGTWEELEERVRAELFKRRRAAWSSTRSKLTIGR